MAIRYALIFILGLSVGFAEKQATEKTRTETPKNAKTAKPDNAVTIPADATEVTPGIYRHTDSSGKSWRYRKTPFGVVKMEDKSPDATPPASPDTPSNPFGGAPGASAAANITAVEEGDTVRFERATPFGPYKWTRKKSELTADEQQVLERSRTRKSENTETKE
jgi:hypothetical protein